MQVPSSRAERTEAVRGGCDLVRPGAPRAWRLFLGRLSETLLSCYHSQASSGTMPFCPTRRLKRSRLLPRGKCTAKARAAAGHQTGE